MPPLVTVPRTDRAFFCSTSWSMSYDRYMDMYMTCIGTSMPFPWRQSYISSHYFSKQFNCGLLFQFQYACLSRCNLSGANLSYCCLERSDLSHANLEGAQLLGVKALCANMEGNVANHWIYDVHMFLHNNDLERLFVGLVGARDPHTMHCPYINYCCGLQPTI